MSANSSSHQLADTRVVYTALMGGYETLQEQPTAADSALRFVCLTDNPQLTSDTWEIVHVEPMFALDATRSARALKVLGHPAIADATESLWIDNRVTLKRDPALLLDDALSTADFACFDHSFREHLVDEFEAVVAQGRDDHARVYEQLFHYAELTPELLDHKPLWTGILARRHSEQVDAAMRVWFDHILRYSRRDQLSILAALATAGVEPHRYRLDNWESAWHSWAKPSSAKVRRVSDAQGSRYEHSIRLPLAKTRGLESQLAVAQDALAQSEQQAKKLAEQVTQYQAQLAKIKKSRAYRLATNVGKMRRRP